MIDIQPTNSISVNQLAQPLVVALLNDAATLNLGISKHNSGAIIVDAGIDVAGGLEAGRRIAEICMGAWGRLLLHNSYRLSIGQQACKSAQRDLC